MLPNFSKEEAAATAERVRKAVDDLRAFDGKVKVTLSVGVAVSSDKGLAQADALVKAADEAMYVSKFTTKNRVCLWPPNPQELTLAQTNKKNAPNSR